MNILVVSKIFAPLTVYSSFEYSARSIQAEKVITELAGLGHKVTVITSTEKDDESCQADQRLESMPNLKIIYLKYDVPAKKNNTIYEHLKWRFTCETEKISRGSSWIKEAFNYANNIISENKFDLIFTLSTPFDSHFVGLLIKEKWNLKWVSFFSDPWPSSILPVPYKSKFIPVISDLQNYYARQVIKKSDNIVVTSNNAINFINERLHISHQSKFVEIPHIGFDFSQLQNIDVDVNFWKNKIVHLGIVTKERGAVPLLQAVKNASIELKDNFGGLVFVGNVCQEFKQAVADYQLDNYIAFCPPVKPDQAMAIAKNAKCLLVIEADMDISPFLPSKFCDYAMASTSIIAITPFISSVRDYLNNYGGGVAVNNSSADIYSAIMNVCAKQLSDDRSGNELSNIFSKKEVIEKYDFLFNNVISK